MHDLTVTFISTFNFIPLISEKCNALKIFGGTLLCTRFLRYNVRLHFTDKLEDEEQQQEQNSVDKTPGKFVLLPSNHINTALTCYELAILRVHVFAFCHNRNCSHNTSPIFV